MEKHLLISWNLEPVCSLNNAVKATGQRLCYLYTTRLNGYHQSAEQSSTS